jgi:LacI family transcriptional regulator
MTGLKRVILLLETSRAFGRDMLHGIARYSKLHGPWSFYREPQGLQSAVPQLSGWKADGIIMRNTHVSKVLLRLGIPTILVLHDETRKSNIPAVITDAKGIAKIAGEHLVNLGLRNFAFCGFDDLMWSNERKKYFIEYISAQDHSPHIYSQPYKGKNLLWDKEQVYMVEWLKRLPKPIGIMACNDDRGQHILEACKTAGLSVPEEVAVIGVDNDIILCELCDPPLSSVALNTELVGYASAELLDQLMKRKTKKKHDLIVSATTVVRRQSTDILAVENVDVAAAMKYIRQHAKKRILTRDVVVQTSLSRRSLEQKFQQYLHRSIHEEILRVRVDVLTQLLVETNLSISEIADLFEFTDPEHISRYFRNATGVGLRAFRDASKRRHPF